MLFHWSIAALVTFEFVSALSFGHFNPGDAAYFHAAYRAHMSGGMVLLVLSLVCVAWRTLRVNPSLSPDAHAVTRVLAKTAHLLLYVFVIAVPVTGWIILSARNRHAVLFDKLSWPNLAFLAQTAYERRLRVDDAFMPIHSTASCVGLGLVGLHVAASIYHHFWRCDTVLLRMLPRLRTRTNQSPGAK